MPTIANTLKEARVHLKASVTPDLDAELLLSHCIKMNRTYLHTWPEEQLMPEQNNAFNALLQQRKTGVPVAYLLGYKDFWSLQLKVSRDTLIPRSETELLVEYILDNFKTASVSLLDLGTGTGAIALAIASEKSMWNITASDISENSLQVARTNARLHQLEHVTFKSGDWFSACGKQRYDIIVSNPPYVPEGDDHLTTSDIRHEPQLALVSGVKGMNSIELIVTGAHDYLTVNGCLIIEHGYDQKELAYDCFLKAGFKKIKQYNDYSGNPRMTTGTL